jgi:DNA (cytosine-5)-methyltransferase 1
MARIVGEVRPRYVFVENSPALVTRGLGRVLSDLAALGYDCRWTVLGAADVGAPHKRERIWIVADADGMRELQPQGGECDERGRIGNGSSDVANTTLLHAQGQHDGSREVEFGRGSWWLTEPSVGRVAHGVAARVDRLKAIGNGQVPSVAATAWKLLTEDSLGLF